MASSPRVFFSTAEMQLVEELLTDISSADERVPIDGLDVRVVVTRVYTSIIQQSTKGVAQLGWGSVNLGVVSRIDRTHLISSVWVQLT